MDHIQAVEQGLQPFGDTTHVLGYRHLDERMAYYGVPGVSIAVIEDGTLHWARSYGLQSEETPTPVTRETRFPAASISKPLVALTVLRLVQDGILDLDTDVNHYLTSWRLPDNDYTQQQKVTLRGLLSHSAGVTTYGFWGYRPSASVPTLVQVLDGQTPANSVPVRVDTIPHTRWRYSSGGYCIIQQVLIDVLRKPFTQLIQEVALMPLGMDHSAFLSAPDATIAPFAACGHDPTGVAVPGRWRTHPELASTGLWSTPTDIAKFVIDVQQSLHDHSNKVLTVDTIREMLSIHIGNWALGVAIDGHGDVSRFSHGGAQVGFRCYMVGYCHRGQGAIVMTNGERGDHLCVEVLHSIARAYGWPNYYHFLDNTV
jgi:CubicO group peptidase (beta-lactamase class C family)